MRKPGIRYQRCLDAVTKLGQATAAQVLRLMGDVIDVGFAAHTGRCSRERDERVVQRKIVQEGRTYRPRAGGRRMDASSLVLRGRYIIIAKELRNGVERGELIRVQRGVYAVAPPKEGAAVVKRVRRNGRSKRARFGSDAEE